MKKGQMNVNAIKHNPLPDGTDFSRALYLQDIEHIDNLKAGIEIIKNCELQDIKLDPKILPQEYTKSLTWLHQRYTPIIESMVQKFLVQKKELIPPGDQEDDSYEDQQFNETKSEITSRLMERTLRHIIPSYQIAKGNKLLTPHSFISKNLYQGLNGMFNLATNQFGLPKDRGQLQTLSSYETFLNDWRGDDWDDVDLLGRLNARGENKNLKWTTLTLANIRGETQFEQYHDNQIYRSKYDGAVENETSSSPNVDMMVAKDLLPNILETLTDREQKVIELCFFARLTQEQVGKEWNVTPARIHQIQLKALRKLRHPNRAKNLKDIDLDKLSNK